MERRQFIRAAAGTAACLPASMLNTSNLEASESGTTTLGRAEHCVMIWLGGGMAQIDTFDPKELGDAPSKKAGSYYPAIDTAVDGVQVCEHLRRMAPLMDRVTALRSVHHDVVDEHAAATNRMHTGRPTSGTVQYPSLGSIVAHQRGTLADGVPGYVLIGYPNPTRGPGFLGQRAGFVYLTDVASGPAGLSRHPDVSLSRHDRRQQLLKTVRKSARSRVGEDRLFREYDEAIEESLRLAGPDFLRVFDVGEEDDSLRESYGDGFGQRCLVARRLCEAGVRFVEVSHNMNFRNGTGWDTHNDGQLNQHLLIQELDQAVSAMIVDLERRSMLEKTLIIINTEFGRPAQFDSGGGRGHYSKCFTVVMAGGGLRHCGAYGTTDELAMRIVDRPVSIPDFFATALAALQIDPATNLYGGDRPIPITDGGKPIAELI
ncbi:MAG: DUF1501 domain-containing protein [Planctomycetales bacterium]|nr:DUF1501 domain-containing protein [Planctomycetales bacterium]